MKQFELYKWQIDRSLNPAVSADGFDEKTIKTEIEEYVFTDEIIQGLYNILVAIRNRDKSHDGIWIDGYFGSGKSHFLKYLNYCLDKRFSEAAMNRLLTAVKEADPILSNLEIQPFQVIDLMNWLKKPKSRSSCSTLAPSTISVSTAATHSSTLSGTVSTSTVVLMDTTYRLPCISKRIWLSKASYSNSRTC